MVKRALSYTFNSKIISRESIDVVDSQYKYRIIIIIQLILGKEL